MMTQFFGTTGANQALETAALRGVARKDGQVEPHDPAAPIGRAGSHIFHAGSGSDLNSFAAWTFPSAVGENVVEFVRGLDTGTAPIVGRSFTVGVGGPGAQDLADIALFEEQAVLANSEIVVEVWRNNGAYEGYWSDVSSAVPTSADL